ncbi:MAG: DUF998 domain-containing protein [Streptosporangiaceae bacterium]
MRGVPWWGVVSAAAAPVLLAAGWAIAGALQPASYSPVADTVSALAEQDAADRWVMTIAFMVVGACYIVTALALKAAASPGRLILIAGGAAGMLVAANPDRPGGYLPHVLWAAVSFFALAVWSAAGCKRGPWVPWGLRPAGCAGSAAVLLGLLVWFGAELILRGGQLGLAERVLGGAQAGWPLVVVLSCWQSQSVQPCPAACPVGADYRS